MGHSKKFEAVKKYYSYRLWSKAKVKNAVLQGWITAEEFKEITGEDYPDAQ
jgi:uncharacterized XkdX family phage protein